MGISNLFLMQIMLLFCITWYFSSTKDVMCYESQVKPDLRQYQTLRIATPHLNAHKLFITQNLITMKLW